MYTLLVEIHALIELSTHTQRERIHVHLVGFLMLKLDEASEELLELLARVQLLQIEILDQSL